MSDLEIMQQALEALEAMNPYPATKADQRASAIEALRARLAEPVAERDALRALLTPFAALLHNFHDDMPDERPVFGIDKATITVGQLRAARAALKEATK